MTSKSFRQFALSIPDTEESEHSEPQDFRVEENSIATLFFRRGVECGQANDRTPS